MRVTIDQREESAGLLSRDKHCFVDCTVQFSEEERAIIKARRLLDESIVVDPAIPMPSRMAVLGGSLLGLGSLVIVGAFVAGMAGVSFSGLLFVIGIGLTVYGAWKRWIVGRRFDRSEEPQEVTVRRLLSRPTFSVLAASPASARYIEEDIRDSLTVLKARIDGSAEPPGRRTFEL